MRPSSWAVFLGRSWSNTFHKKRSLCHIFPESPPREWKPPAMGSGWRIHSSLKGPYGAATSQEPSGYSSVFHRCAPSFRDGRRTESKLPLWVRQRAITGQLI